MDDHLRQLFETQLAEAADRLADRAVHRCGGHQAALEQLQADPEGDGVWVGAFVDAWFAEQLWETPSGACFVLEALSRRSLPPDPGGLAADVLGRLARAAFSDVLVRQTAQLVQRSMVFEG